MIRENGGEGEDDKVILKKEVSSTSLQNPSDPDATYGHKGKGYKVQIVKEHGLNTQIIKRVPAGESIIVI